MQTRKQGRVACPLVVSSRKTMENTPDHYNKSDALRKSAEDCAICLDKVQEERTLKCRHSFCSQCIDSVFRVRPACPICNTYHGVYTGTQPPGTMTVTRSWQRLPGYEHCGCIVIQYSFPAGTQGPEHPNPGVRYSSTSRTAYLPACEEGEKVARLLRKAFDRRLVFTIGQSVTTGHNNVVTWNDIHHKTNMGGGPQCNADRFTDLLHRQNTTAELASSGVFGRVVGVTD
ncbi:hypothetical protein F2P81_011628 [Scophthalmus maximus]|uniref:E3 ubiquitin-protein ligase n=1 Tax=Scophthalmus maximus TaxID=52904 RepID=A0A6A4SM73_SCOMX|nr:hypothetical protein F2P81_011628 [Scophthalmus maximus]